MNRHASDTPASDVTPAGADWLASASPFPRSVHALWSQRPAAPAVLPCGGAFDVVSLPALPGRRVLELLWSRGAGSGPAAAVRDRTLLFAAPGTAARLPALLSWEEWRPGLPPALCHGPGDAVTLPPVYGRREGSRRGGGALAGRAGGAVPVAAGPEGAAVGVRAGRGGRSRIPIFDLRGPGAKVDHVDRRR